LGYHVSEALLRVDRLKTYFPVRGDRRRVVRAVDDVTFEVPAGRIVGLVGESGSGKTTIGRSILRLVPSTSGRVVFDGTDLLALSDREMRAFRRRLQIIFQDPFSSLNPRMTVAEIIGEALLTHGLAPGKSRRPRTAELLERVGLDAAQMDRYPHEFSGGQRQRIGIARAIAVEPQFIVADEAVSALDVSVQAQVLNLLLDLQQALGLTMLFIAHDLAVVEYLCDDVVVLYLGRVMERAPRERLYTGARHPYTKALLSAVPVPEVGHVRDRMLLKGDIPSPIDPPSGCVFRTRCPYAIGECASMVPPLVEVAPGHAKACIRDDVL
jgi:peptide/nickel transport system ATP-binding protein